MPVKDVAKETLNKEPIAALKSDCLRYYHLRRKWKVSLIGSSKKGCLKYRDGLRPLKTESMSKPDSCRSLEMILFQNVRVREELEKNFEGLVDKKLDQMRKEIPNPPVVDEKRLEALMDGKLEQVRKEIPEAPVDGKRFDDLVQKVEQAHKEGPKVYEKDLQTLLDKKVEQVLEGIPKALAVDKKIKQVCNEVLRAPAFGKKEAEDLVNKKLEPVRNEFSKVQAVDNEKVQDLDKKTEGHAPVVSKLEGGVKELTERVNTMDEASKETFRSQSESLSNLRENVEKLENEREQFESGR
ncbi:hypothetical protein TSTA_034010 [Talaromyces stipitatus ATCC 10500]|uniref:Uncharacterized protein n=1 Tax=Talaromyces stipitatus (strain ATCC 10500 / CBS 375.48 / QM 6759 / NRRL 1006) TaxID=441959 RepID=B8M6U2_TALSN|nr:uncharacterized protein TSTA_034010 [Talaromyces stipitatus ATCC 10500]EED20162.1 hypothetical protein TSTA_034010 [Talaromyces stipitatus ATCC 10500]